ncbi:MAG: putative membrane-bound dehydrogenase-like protein [Chlamydiales bacterium]|jgi:putative membrane-bound dehydrogenase-like protein
MCPAGYARSMPYKTSLRLLVALCWIAGVRAQDNDDSLTAFEVHPGLEVTLWAESPELYNPTAIDVDARGRLWVTEAVNYRKWDGQNPGRDHDRGDRVVILEDTDGDGLCDVSRVFVQDEDLVAPLGISVLGNRVFVSCSPNIFVYTDTDGDDRPDQRDVFLTGFGGFDHDHGVHSLVVGPDGAWYGAVGNAGPHLVTDADGWSLRSGSYYSGGGPEQADNKPGLVSDDGRVWTGGLVYSVQPSGGGLRVLAHNFRNNYEVSLDAFGNLFQSDNDDDGNRSCRTLWVMEGGNYGFFSNDGSRSWQADQRPRQEIPIAHWHQDDPGVMPAGTITGAGGPTGVALYEATLPGMLQELDGAVLNADAGAGVVYAHLPRRVGAGLELEQRNLIGRASANETRAARWFRPSDVAVSTDGSIFVADWFDPAVGGHKAGDREAYGRILRLAPPNSDPSPVSVAIAEPAQHVAALASPAVSVRAEALRRIAALDQMPDLSSLLASPIARLRARGVFAQSFFTDAIAGVQDESEDVRIASLRALRARAARDTSAPGNDAWLAHAKRLARDPSPAVRAEVAISLRDLPLAQSLEALLHIARSYPIGDRTYLEAFGIGATGKESELFDALVGVDPASALDWTTAQAHIAWRLHPEQSIASLRARAFAAELDLSARRKSIDALAFIPTLEAGEAMLDVAIAGPDDGRDLALWWIENRDTNDWRAFALLDQIERSGIDAAERVYASGVIHSGMVNIDVDVRGALKLWLSVNDGGDGNACDWADWIEPRFEGPQGAQSLVELDWIDPSAEWGDVRNGLNCVGDALRVGDTTFERGIGTHASSVIGFTIPAGTERFVSRAGPDASGTTQGRTSLEFEIFLERPHTRDAVINWQSILRDSSGTGAPESEAIEGLAADAEGGLMLIRLASEGSLDEEQKALCGQHIYSNPDLSVRALASEWFPRPGYEDAHLPSIAELGALPADARKGRAVFLSDEAQCTSCHTFRGRGGAIGPDLTEIRDKLDRSALFDAILNPSAGIAHGYDTWLIETTSGVLHSGFILADGEDLILKDTQGKRRVIPADEIEARYEQKLSTMPEGVALGLSATQFVNMVAFLRQDVQRAPTYGKEIQLFDGVSLDGWTSYSNDPSVATDSIWSVRDGVLSCAGNPIGYLQTESEFTNYQLTLEWRFDPELGPGNSGVLLRKIGPDMVWPNSIEAQLQHRSAGDIWNIGEFPMWTSPDRLQGRRTVKSNPSNELPLGEWNRYVITMDRGSLTLEVNGEIQNTATWCDEVAGTICLQSEGAAIQFRNIRLRPIR